MKKPMKTEKWDPEVYHGVPPVSAPSHHHTHYPGTHPTTAGAPCHCAPLPTTVPAAVPCSPGSFRFQHAGHLTRSLNLGLLITGNILKSVFINGQFCQNSQNGPEKRAISDNFDKTDKTVINSVFYTRL